MATFLLEIGTEELPADFAAEALQQLRLRAEHDLAEAGLQPGSIRVDGTPRRLALRLLDLPQRQPDRREDRKGPPAQQAFRDGRPTPAAEGFARRCGVDPASLTVRDTDRGPFVFATIQQAGRSSLEVLGELVPAWISVLQGRRFMRWGSADRRFSRPLRWLVALLGSEIVPITLADCDPPVVSDRTSRGHRLRSGALSLPSAEAYTACLAAADVQVERDVRAAAIRAAIETAAAEAQAAPDLPEALFEELVDLVESPRLLQGEIEERFLALPPEVLRTVMRAHQRYVPLLRLDAPADPLALEAHAALLPRFLCVSNGRPEASDTIRRGNERVLRARLADAAFFLHADRAVASIDRRDQLGRVTFAEGLGSLRDRVERLEWCTDGLLQALALPAAVAAHARRAAHLCKHDLVSQMVGEFPELQGVMGGKYLLAEGEERAVALAVLEHYQPRAAGDDLPHSDAGAVVALAERLELLLSIFARGERPSGSSDPYALRRAGNGLLLILRGRGWRLDLPALFRSACEHWSRILPQCAFDPAALAVELAEFLRQRQVSLLEEEGFAGDLVQAVAGEGLPLERVLSDPADALSRCRLLHSLRASGALAAVQEVVQRAARLAQKSPLPDAVLSPAGVVHAELFEKPCEQAMLAVLERLAPIATAAAGLPADGAGPSGAGSHGAGTAGADEDAEEGYRHLAEGLAGSADRLAAFFDGPGSVLVMAEDLTVRENRLHLLAVLRNQASVLADFSRLAG